MNLVNEFNDKQEAKSHIHVAVLNVEQTNQKTMINRLIRAIAGTFIIISVLLGMYVNENWFWFTIFVGANLLQSSITKWCLMEDILRKVFKVKD